MNRSLASVWLPVVAVLVAVGPWGCAQGPTADAFGSSQNTEGGVPPGTDGGGPPTDAGGDRHDAGASGGSSGGGSSSGAGSSGGSSGGADASSDGGGGCGSRYFPASRFDAPLPASPQVDPNSATIIASFVQDYMNAYGSVGVHSDATGGMPIYAVPGNQPLVPVGVNQGANDFRTGGPGATGNGIPIPPNARTANDLSGDSPLVIYQPSTDTEWEFWQAVNDGGAWSASWGGMITGVSTAHGEFPSPYGMSASGISYLATEITFDDVLCGVIPHAISIDVYSNCNGSVLPADRTDCGDNPGQPSEGTWFFMPKNVPEPQGLAPFAHMVFVALQNYGAVAIDQAGAVMVNAENSMDWTQTGHSGTDPINESFNGLQEYQVVANLPWSQMQVLVPSGS